MKRALVTGVTGQDGSYLAEYLVSRGREDVKVMVDHSGVVGNKIPVDFPVRHVCEGCGCFIEKGKISWNSDRNWFAHPAGLTENIRTCGPVV